MRLLAIASLVVLSLACGGSDRSGADAAPAVIDAAASTVDATPALSVPDATYLDQLTSDQAMALCQWMVDIQGGPHTITCSDGTMITIDPVADCLANVWPHCQVGLLRPCVEGQAQDQCGPAPAACTTFYQCAGG